MTLILGLLFHLKIEEERNENVFFYLGVALIVLRADSFFLKLRILLIVPQTSTSVWLRVGEVVKAYIDVENRSRRHIEYRVRSGCSCISPKNVFSLPVSEVGFLC